VSEHPFLTDLPNVLATAGLNVMISEHWLDGQCRGSDHYMWTDPVTGDKSHTGSPSAFMVHHTAGTRATPPPTDTSKANAWIGLERDGKLYQTGGGVPTIYLASAGPTRIGSGYGYRLAAWDYTFKQLRAPVKAADVDGVTALNRYAFNAEVVHAGDGSALDVGVLAHVIGLGRALEGLTGLSEMTLGHLSWTGRKIDPFWNGDRECIVTIQDAIADSPQPPSDEAPNLDECEPWQREAWQAAYDHDRSLINVNTHPQDMLTKGDYMVFQFRHPHHP